MRVRILLSLIAALSSLPGAPQKERPKSSPALSPYYIFGAYGNRTAGSDLIRVTEKSSGWIGVSVRLYYAGGHTCRLSQSGRWHEDHVAVVANGLDPNRPCRLNLFFENGAVRLEDEGRQCTPVYCGTRGKLDSVSLRKVP